MTGRIISVAQQKGGSGKTTLAAHLAVALAARGAFPVAVVDIDPQGSLGTWYEAREGSLGDGTTGLTFRTSSGWGARREARSLARDHGLVILDTPPKTDSDVRPAIEAADLVLVPMQPTQVDLWATGQTVDIARREGTDSLVVLNRVPPRAALTAEVMGLIGENGFTVASARLGNRTAFAASMGEGLTILETEPRGKGADEARLLAEEVARLLGLEF
ncbi:ParA family partition ATPase [Stappia indica]|jgi:chromosome partitioning protein|uniref:AAA family ATPase n=1 Tax=Stappia indica TaxID=538381 RepID=A0A857C3I9_9HYPH|nr:ParA family partition ATPase [Stappia indica]QGZ33586.1 AAA family ATPase [Stappia indica]